MSAFTVGSDHIDYLVSVACQWSLIRGMDESAFGQMLWDENYRSVSYRYDGRAGGDRAPQYRWKPVHTPDLQERHLPQVLKAVACLEYQSCEHPEWESSDAARALRNIRETAIYKLPGYDDAQWEWLPDSVRKAS